MKNKPTNGQWRNRIVGYGAKPADQFQANPANWRQHPQSQRAALAGSLAEVGWVQNVVENQRTGNLVDGHERVWQALQRGEEVPYTLVDLSEDEEKLILATLDPIGAMAVTDREQLDALFRDVQTDDEGVMAMLSELAQKEGIIAPQIEFKEYDETIEDEVEFIECSQCGHRWPK